MTTLKEDLADLSGPAVYDFKRWNRDWVKIEIARVNDRRARVAAVPDAAVVMDWLARRAFARLKSALWSRREISLKTKGRICKALIRTILLYGCET